MLREAGAPSRENDLVGDVILETGTMWHQRVADMLVRQGVAFMQEVRMDAWLPPGWGGTADWIFWHPEYEGFVLGDLKTTTGEGIPFIEREGLKIEHHHQLSAYWHAMADAGFPLVRGFGVLYLPKNRAKNYKTEPILVEAQPLDREYLYSLMRERRELVDSYLPSVAPDTYWGTPGYVTDELAPPIERVQKVVWNKDKWELKLVPHWSAQFCPYDDDLCDCNTTGETKVGEYIWRVPAEGDDDFSYGPRTLFSPRKGYEDTTAPVLTNSQEKRMNESSR